MRILVFLFEAAWLTLIFYNSDDNIQYKLYLLGLLGKFSKIVHKYNNKYLHLDSNLFVQLGKYIQEHDVLRCLSFGLYVSICVCMYVFLIR